MAGGYCCNKYMTFYEVEATVFLVTSNKSPTSMNQQHCVFAVFSPTSVPRIDYRFYTGCVIVMQDGGSHNLFWTCAILILHRSVEPCVASRPRHRRADLRNIIHWRKSLALWLTSDSYTLHEQLNNYIYFSNKSYTQMSVLCIVIKLAISSEKCSRNSGDWIHRWISR